MKILGFLHFRKGVNRYQKVNTHETLTADNKPWPNPLLEIWLHTIWYDHQIDSERFVTTQSRHMTYIYKSRLSSSTNMILVTVTKQKQLNGTFVSTNQIAGFSILSNQSGYNGHVTICYCSLSDILQSELSLGLIARLLQESTFVHHNIFCLLVLCKNLWCSCQTSWLIVDILSAEPSIFREIFEVPQYQTLDWISMSRLDF